MTRVSIDPDALLATRGRCRIMGVVNVTPDSFSDGGRALDPDTAVRHGLALLAAGADLLDVGGESTRPGADAVSGQEELRRILPVVSGLAVAGAPVSVDTYRASVAAAALEAGAVMVNDISGGLADPAMLPLLADRAVPCVLMHWRGPAKDMQAEAVYDDVVAEVTAALAQRRAAALAAGIAPHRVALDPGLGFGKTAAHNWSLLARLDRLVGLGAPLLVGASRKAFLGGLLAGPDGPRPVQDREDATATVSTLAALAGAWAVRVHAPAPSADAVRVVAALRAAQVGTGGGGDAADTITLRGLRVRGHHGVLAQERRDGQDFVIDAELHLDTADAAGSDDLARTVDYGALSAQLAAVVAGEPVELLETLAARLVDECLTNPRVREVQVAVHKPQAPLPVPFDDVIVTVRRTRAVGMGR